MDESRARIEKPVWIAIIVASAVAATTFNSLAFGLNALRVYDSSVHTFFIAVSVASVIIAIDHWLHERSLTLRLVVIVIAIVPTTYIGVWIAATWLYFFNPFESYRRISPSNRTVLFSLAISYIFGLGGYLLTSARQSLFVAKRAVEEKAEAEARAKSLAQEARLASLESRIHPHFLFNTLNSIAALIREDPDKAERTVERLSTVLRYSLSPENESKTTVKNEMKLVSDYLEIQKTRFEERLSYDFRVDPEFVDCEIPSFSIHTFVENALKHADPPNDEPIEISVEVSGQPDEVILEITDNGLGFSESDLKRGHGLDNLRERLKSMYRNSALLDLSESASGRILLRIPRKNVEQD